MSLINHRRRSAIWHGASQKVGQSAAPLFLDRIDIQCEITPVPFKDISKAAPGEPSANIRERVIKAREIQAARYKDYKGIHCNAQMTERMIHQFAEPNEAGIDMLRMAMEKLSISKSLQSHSESCPHHRRPGRLRACGTASSGRSHRLSCTRPWRLG